MCGALMWTHMVVIGWEDIDDEGRKGQEQLCDNKLKSVVSHCAF